MAQEIPDEALDAIRRIMSGGDEYKIDPGFEPLSGGTWGSRTGEVRSTGEPTGIRGALDEARPSQAGGLAIPAIMLAAANQVARGKGGTATLEKGNQLVMRDVGGKGNILRLGREMLDPATATKGLSIEGIEGGAGYGAADEFSELVGEAVQSGASPMQSGDAQRATARALTKGKISKLAGIKGYISQGSSAGRALAKRFGGAAKGAVGGVSALLAPMFGAIQSGPEGKAIMRQLGLGDLYDNKDVFGPQG